MIRNAALRITKNTFALFSGKVTALLFSFAFVVYVARFLGVNGFGKYSLVKTYFQLFLSLAATGLSIVITREIAQKPGWVNRYLSVSIVFVSALAVAASIILVILTRIFHYSLDTRQAMAIASLALLPAAVAAVFESAFVALERAEYVTYATLIENVSRICISLLVLHMGFGLASLFVILVAMQVFILVLYTLFLRRLVSQMRWDFEWASLKQLVHNWKAFAMENWLSNILGNFDVIVLSWLHGEAAVGLYSAAKKLLALGVPFVTSFTTAIFPYLSQLSNESEKAFKRVSEESLKYMLVIILPAVVTVAVLADQFILLLYTDAYTGSIPILRIVIWLLALKFLNLPLSYTLFAQGEQRRSLKVAAISLAIYVPVGLWLTSQWAAIGAAWASLLSMTVAFCFYFVFAFHGQDATRILLRLGKAVLAAGVMGVFIMFMKDFPLVLLVSSAVVLYTVLLVLLKVISLSEVESAQRLAQTVLRGVSKALRRVLFREMA